MDLTHLVDMILARADHADRFITAIAGPPAAGKSTLAARLAEAISERGEKAAIIPMDGFHYDDAVLAARSLSHRKGAPETFDFPGFRLLLQRLREREPEVAIPLFDREMELSRAGAAIVESDARILLVEGNYLLLDESPWNTLERLFDFSIYLDVPCPDLKRRLLERWNHHGRDAEAARHWVENNDLPNARRVAKSRRKADIVV